MQTLIGQVISNKLDKTVTVLVRRRFPHPVYGKQLTRTKKYQVHNETLAIEVGETVKFIPCKPISKLKRWTVVEVVDVHGKGKIQTMKAAGKEKVEEKVSESKTETKKVKKADKPKAAKKASK